MSDAVLMGHTSIISFNPQKHRLESFTLILLLEEISVLGGYVPELMSHR